MERLEVGIIGCGEAAQALHIPTLNSLAHLFRVRACCDVSPDVMQDVAARAGARAVSDPVDLICDPSIDVVLVATSDAYHADFVLAACEARKRAVLVEKPLTLSSRIGHEIAAAAATSGVPVLVGYPHVYEPAVHRAMQLWGPSSTLRYGEFRCVIGPNPAYIADVIQTVRPNAVDPWPAMISRLDYTTVATELLGARIHPMHLLAHQLLTTLTIHDLPVMRRLLGEPLGIDYARVRTPTDRRDPIGLSIDVLFDYGPGRVLLQTELQDIKTIDWGFHLRRDALHVTVKYPTTYAAAAPSTCTARYEKEGMTVDEQHGGQYETGFRREWKHLHEVVTKHVKPLTGVADAVRDLELAEQIFQLAVRTHPAETPR